ncbi:MAG: DUF2183 domain-containing protein [Saprospiraceae bacterium]|nr:DUF2183 domain-containing protein [Saprospiraceae bacterium]
MIRKVIMGRHWLRKKQNIIIQPYRGYSSINRLYLGGRVLEDEQITLHRDESFFQTLRNNYKRWESDEIADVPVTLQIGQQIHQTVTDREGYFLFDEAEGISLHNEEQWKIAYLTADFVYRHTNYDLTRQAEIFLPNPTAEFGIISDIDDTIMHTDVLYRLRMLKNTFLYNPYKRRPLPGMATWINALRKGPKGTSSNPVFYVSKSPRNIFDYLSVFLQFNQFPKGPILLRDFGRTGVRPPDYPGHKLDEIDKIFQTYPGLSFILIGDIAGRDAEIYHHFQKKYPSQVLSIYLRNIIQKNRDKIFYSWRNEHNPINFQLIENPLEGATHSLQQGWIGPFFLDKIKNEVKDS